MTRGIDYGLEPLDQNYDADDVTETALATMRACCKAFVRKVPYAAARAAARMGWDQVGHDLWLTQNDHGTGFWDREEIAADDQTALTNAACDLGNTYLIVGDDGRLRV